MQTRRPLTVVALLLGLFISAMEMTVVSTAMPTAVGDLGGLHIYAWAFASYMLAATVTVPIWGKLADLHGRKPVLQLGTVLFLAGSAACGFAPSMEWLVAFRLVQGLGAGAMQPISLTIVGDLFDVRERARIQGVFGAVWGIAGLVGPLLGGFIVHALSWRWVFWINLPIGIAALAVLQVAFHERVERHPHGLDVPGALLLSSGVLLALLAARSPGAAAWAAPLAVAAVAAFLWQERRAPEPLVPLDLFRSPVVATSSAAGALVGAAMFSFTSYLPLHAQALQGATPTGAGSVIAPMAIGWPIASALGGRLLPRLGFRPLVRGGLFLAGAAAVLIAATLRPGAPLAWTRWASGLYGLGLGFANTALVISVQSSVPWQRRGVATASTLFFRTIGGTLAVGLLGGALTAAVVSRGVDPLVAEKLLSPERSALDPAQVAGAAGALSAGMQVVLWSAAGLAALAFVVSLAFPRLAADAPPARAGAAD